MIYITVAEVAEWMYRIACVCLLNRCIYFFAAKAHSARGVNKAAMFMFNHAMLHSCSNVKHLISCE